jgi:nucleotide-binding universal stress UspA family protein
VDCLIVANQTLGGPELERAVLARIEQGRDDFYIVVPLVPPDVETLIWMGPENGVTITTPEAVEEAERRSEERLSSLIETIRAAGGTAKGEVGENDPYLAVKRVLARHSFDEIIVSTLPAPISRWLRMDLPSRVSRAARVPVTVVQAEE